MSEEGIERRIQRWKVEAVFGNIKQNKGFRRFSLRGIENVTIETGLKALAHNLQHSAKPHQASPTKGFLSSLHPSKKDKNP